MLRLSEPLETVLQADGVRDGGQVEGDVPERVDGGGDSLAHLAHHVALQLAREDGVHDAGALRGLDVGAVDEVPVEEVQQRDEELVRVLLLVARQVVRVRPDHVEQLVRRQRRGRAAEELLEELRDLAHDARVLRGGLAHVPVREEVVPQQRRVDQHLGKINKSNPTIDHMQFQMPTWTMQLMKQVLPRLMRPRSPVVEFLLKPSRRVFSLSSSSSLLVGAQPAYLVPSPRSRWCWLQ